MVKSRSKNISTELADQYTHIDSIVNMMHDISSIFKKLLQEPRKFQPRLRKQMKLWKVYLISQSWQNLLKILQHLSINSK